MRKGTHPLSLASFPISHWPPRLIVVGHKKYIFIQVFEARKKGNCCLYYVTESGNEVKTK